MAVFPVDANLLSLKPPACPWLWNPPSDIDGVDRGFRQAASATARTCRRTPVSSCSRLMTPEGFLLHKYNPDGSAGSSWHPWMSPDGKRQLPIQEDETALVLWALWEHFAKFHDVEFVKPLK